MTGGQCLEDLELKRRDEAYLDALGTTRIPDPTTAGDFCRRFTSADDVNTLQKVLAEFDYKPTACGQSYRMIVIRKNLSKERGERVSRVVTESLECVVAS